MGFTKNIILVVISLIAGFFLNKLANDQANKKLLAQLEADLAIVNQAQKTARGAQSEELSRRKSDIEAQIRILSKK